MLTERDKVNATSTRRWSWATECPLKRLFFSQTSSLLGIWPRENAEIEPGDTVAVCGCGPVAQMAIQSSWMLGVGRVIAIDRVPERLDMTARRSVTNERIEDEHDHPKSESQKTIWTPSRHK